MSIFKKYSNEEIEERKKYTLQTITIEDNLGSDIKQKIKEFLEGEFDFPKFGHFNCQGKWIEPK